MSLNNQLVYTVVFAFVVLGCSPAKPAASTSAADLPGFFRQIKLDPTVVMVGEDGGFLNITVKDDLTKAKAVSFACNGVKPQLKDYGLEGTMFALYDSTGEVLATGSSRCN